AASAPESAVGRTARHVIDRVTRDVRYLAASAPGIAYRLAGRHPNPDVGDDVLADRIRSSLGPLEKRLDVPRVHVMVEDHVALVHGDVPNEEAAGAIEHAIMHVSGVKGVESHLHAGFVAGDTRPSQGAAVRPPTSDALRALLDAASDAGAAWDPRAAVHATLCAFMDRIPEGERAQVNAHLPADVRALAGPARWQGERPRRLKTLPQLVAAAIAEGGITPVHAEEIVRAVVATLRSLVPNEDRDVAAVLPRELRELWEVEPAR
ncbi:MAG TPA: DUF2267 domain-containing protein, partial [Acidimicrobiia bacterium]